MRVALCYNQKRAKAPRGLPPDADAEWDSIETIHAVRDALAERHQCVLVEGDLDCYAKLRKLKPAIVFNIAEGWGGPSREGYVPTICEMLGIPYTASDPVTLNLCLQKSHTTDILRAHGLPVPFSVVIPVASPPRQIREAMRHLVGQGLVVKPIHEGSSKGVRDSSLVRDLERLLEEVSRVHRTYHQAALAERFLEGREFTVAMLGNPPVILPIIEVDLDELPPDTNPLYSYEAKWVWDTAAKPLDIFKCPAKLKMPLDHCIRDICRQAWDVLGIRDWCRIDLRCDETGNPHLLEVNPLPGILPNPADNSCFPKAARAAGISYSQLINRVLDAAIARVGL